MSRRGLLVSLALYVCFSATSLARPQAPFLVKDIDPGTTGSSPGKFADWGGLFVFAAYDPVLGNELWTSDGTEVGTQILKDCWPGAGHGFPSPHTAVEYNGYWYFRARNGVNGTELWRSDGTTSGTSLFFDFALGSTSSIPFVSLLGGQLLIKAWTPTLGNEWWTSDGTVAGTQLLMDLNPGQGSGVSSYRLFQGKMFFAGSDGVSGFELWCTDGTVGGTTLVKEVNPGPDSSSPTIFIEHLGVLFFRGDDGVHGREPWTTDGTGGGTQLVFDIDPGPGSSDMSMTQGALLSVGILARAETAAYGSEPWVTDGTAAGTYMLGDLNPGPGDSSPLVFDLHPGAAMFRSTTPNEGYEPWVTDGTPGGTFVVDLLPGPGDGYAAGNSIHGVADDRAYFSGRTMPGFTWELGVSDGTVAGTGIVKDLEPGTSQVSTIEPVGDEFILFRIGGRASYSDGTAQWTHRIPGAPGAAPLYAVFEARRVGDMVFMNATTGSGGAEGEELWAYEYDVDGDGTNGWFDELNFSTSCECSVVAAPCGNADPSAGCANSTGSGGRIQATATTVVTNDDLVLTATGLPPNQFGILFMGPTLGAPLPFSDGARCVSGNVVRWPAQNAGSSGTLVYGPGLVAQAATTLPAEFQLNAGDTWHFQGWYRDPTGPCGTFSNLTSSASATFTP